MSGSRRADRRGNGARYDARLADYDQARAHLTECLALFRHPGDRSGEARVYQALGWVAGARRRYAESSLRPAGP